RHIYSGSADFCLYDLYVPLGAVNENVFAYSNRAGNERSLVFYNNAYAEAGGWICRSAVAIPQKDGGFRQDNLCQALGLRGADPYFTLFREQRQDLWYIRSSREIAERGFFVSLKGYEAQVFIDIHEVEDDKRGRFARLHTELNGRGVRDVHTAIQDIYLGELYHRFAELFRPDHLDLLFGALKSGARQDKPAGVPPKGTAKSAGPKSAAGGAAIADVADSLKDAILGFAAVAEKFLDGALYDPFVTSCAYPKIPGEQIWKEFAAHLKRLKTLTEYGFAAPHKGDAPAVCFLRSLGEKLNAKPALIVFAYAYGALSLLRGIIGSGTSGLEARALIDHWTLDRKLRELFAAYDVGEGEANRVLDIMKAVLARTCPVQGTTPAENATPPADKPVSTAAVGEPSGLSELSPAEKIVLDNYYEEDFRRLLRVNIFEGVIWFNKESFEDLLFYAPLFAALESDTAFSTATKGAARPPKTTAGAETAEDWLSRIARIAGLVEAFSGAEEKSGYQLGELLGALGTMGSQAKPKGKK
ncbi:MAG: alpha-amylase, partial [Treponema sp.]|nr:alpha-amylase [Treponema sp.]